MSILIHVDPAFTPHWSLDLSNADYHGDKSAANSSSLKAILKSPASFKSAYMGLDRKETDAFRIGGAVHCALSQPALFEQLFVKEPLFSGLTKDGRESTQSKEAREKKEQWKASLKADAIVLKEDEHNDLLEMMNSVLSHREACNLLKRGQSELSGYYADPETGIKCRIRADSFYENSMVLLDIKTTRGSCEPSEFSKTCWDYRIDFQMAMYCEGIRHITGKSVELPLLLVIEKQAPFECALFQADEQMMVKGLTDYRRALDKLKFCLDNDLWLSRQLDSQRLESTNIQSIGLPPWAYKEG